MRVFIKRRSETRPTPLDVDTIEELASFLERGEYAKALIRYRGQGTPFVIELSPLAIAHQRETEQIDISAAKRFDLNRMKKHQTPVQPETWMSEEQLTHYSETKELDWQYYGDEDDLRFRLA